MRISRSPTGAFVIRDSTFHIPGRFYPPASPLGRWLRRRAADEWQAEGRYLVVLTLLVTALVLAHLLAWTVLPPTLPAVLTAGGATMGILLLATVGRQPAIAVSIDRRRLRVRQGARALDVPLDGIVDCEVVDAEAYHRHWRRYSGTHRYVNRVPKRMLLLHTEDGPVALGLMLPALERLQACLRAPRHRSSRRLAELP